MLNCKLLTVSLIFWAQCTLSTYILIAIGDYRHAWRSLTSLMVITRRLYFQLFACSTLPSKFFVCLLSSKVYWWSIERSIKIPTYFKPRHWSHFCKMRIESWSYAQRLSRITEWYWQTFLELLSESQISCISGSFVILDNSFWCLGFELTEKT